MDEDTIFTILSHPLRRRILQEIYEFDQLAYSTMATWNVSTGTIYHHLKILASLITQNENSLYVLTDEGRELTEWFLHQPSGKVVVEQISTHTSFYPVIKHIFRYPRILTFLSALLFFSSLYTTNIMQTVNVGPFLIQSATANRLAYSIAVFSIGILLYFAMIHHFLRPSIGPLLYATGGYFLSLVPASFTIIASFILNFSWNTEYGVFLWASLMVFFQLFFLLLNTTILIVYYGGKIYQSTAIVIFQLYFYLFISLILTSAV